MWTSEVRLFFSVPAPPLDFVWGGGGEQLRHAEVPGQGSILHHSTDPSCHSDNAGSLTLFSRKRTPICLFKIQLYIGEIG